MAVPLRRPETNVSPALAGEPGRARPVRRARRSGGRQAGGSAAVYRDAAPWGGGLVLSPLSLARVNTEDVSDPLSLEGQTSVPRAQGTLRTKVGAHGSSPADERGPEAVRRDDDRHHALDQGRGVATRGVQRGPPDPAPCTGPGQRPPDLYGRAGPETWPVPYHKNPFRFAGRLI